MVRPFYAIPTNQKIANMVMKAWRALSIKGLANKALQDADKNEGDLHPAHAGCQPSQLNPGDHACAGEEQLNWLVAMINHVPDFIYAKDLQGRFLLPMMLWFATTDYRTSEIWSD